MQCLIPEVSSLQQGLGEWTQVCAFSSLAKPVLDRGKCEPAGPFKKPQASCIHIYPHPTWDLHIHL